MQPAHVTLTQFLIEERRRYPRATGELNGLILSVALACKTIATQVSQGALAGVLGAAGEVNVQGEAQQRLDVVANAAFLDCVDGGGHAAAVASEEMARPVCARVGGGRYLLAFDPLDGSSNIDVNVAVGSIFSILRAPEGAEAGEERAFLQPGTRQVAAGYAIYGPSTMLVLSVGTGVHAFTLDRSIGEFLLTHRAMRVPERTSEFAINASNSRHWEPPVRRYVAECLEGGGGPRGRDFNMRWIASLVAEAHRILVRGGVFLYPRDRKDPGKPGRLRLLYEANPVGFLIEQAGGRASTGSRPILEAEPACLHQRVPFVFGSREEVERIEQYHADDAQRSELDLPLFNVRGLFRDSVGA
jgi:fructose-1,6-bisphosphatase I/sedoheptulose-1,7-bisphosphatase